MIRRPATSGGSRRASSRRFGNAQHLRVAGLRRGLGHRSSSDADSASRYSVACGCVRRYDAGHAVVIGPSSAALHRRGLALLGHDREHTTARSSAGIVTVIACVGTSSMVAKWPSRDLLAARRRLERDDLDVERIVEVGDRRVVEREVAVLADPAAAQVERVRAQEVGVAARFRLGVAGVALEIVELP